MQSKQTVKLLLLFLFLSLNLFAIDGKIRVFIKANDAIYTSQKVTVSVELLSDAFSITDAKINFPASAKYIVQAPQSAAYLGKDEIDGNDWQLVHYDYEVYALQAGQIEIPPVSVSFSSSMGYGQPKKDFELKSNALHFDVKTPEGIKNKQFVLVTDNYTLTSEQKPEKKQLIIGDAIEVTVTQKADDVPDILLRPIRYQSNAFLRVYDKEPELRSGLGGKFSVSRTDRFTFVASAEGNVTLPPQEIVWWNSKTKKVHVETLPKISFEILPDPQIAIDAQREKEKKLLLYAGFSVLLLLIGYKLLSPVYYRYMQKREEAYRMSEKGKFAVLLKSIKSNDTPGIYRDLYQWLTVISPELAKSGFRGIAEVQASFSVSLAELEAALSDPERTFDKRGFASELKKLRETLLKEQQRTEQGLQKTLNP